MNKKQTERILIGVVAAILVLYGIYQVAYGTNESSYRWGYSQAVIENNCYIKQKSECMDDVGMSDVCVMRPATNRTACNDGWADAFAYFGHETRAQALCDADIQYCVGGLQPYYIKYYSH